MKKKGKKNTLSISNKIPPNHNKLIVVLGPTASGKTDLALTLAKKFKGEILCADSRQIYRKMDIATAKPSKAEQKAVPHHLFNITFPNKPLNVALYKKIAEKTIKDIQKRGKMPFLVGGTGLYIKAIVDNLSFPKLKPNPVLRRKLEEKNLSELFLLYEKLDPTGSKQIDRKNKRRLVRAIEVCQTTGKPFWEQRKNSAPLFDTLEIGIKIPKEKLEKRIVKRIDKMFKSGLEKEVKGLAGKYGFAIAPMKTIGYQEFEDYFARRINKKELSALISLRTIQFAKRQETWFKKDKKIKWVESRFQAEKLIINFLD